MPIVVHMRLPTFDLYVGSGEGSSPLINFLSVRPGVKIGGNCGTLKVSCNFVVNVCIERMIVPSSLCSRSRPIKSLGFENFTSKCVFNCCCISCTRCSGPEIKASSTYRIRKAASSLFRHLKRQGSFGHWVYPICLKTLTVCS